MTELCDIAYRYGTDKCPRIKHSYTPTYYNMFKGIRNKVKKVIELGIGTPETMKHSRFYALGASLYMWRDFFPKAEVFGVDMQPQAIFRDERIRCFLGDELEQETWNRVFAFTGSDIDIFIDDGSHQKEHQIAVAKMVMPMLDEKTIYIIEDVSFPDKVKQGLSEYDCEIIKSPIKFHDDHMVIVRRK